MSKKLFHELTSKKLFHEPAIHQQQQNPNDIMAPPPAQSGRSINLSEKKRRLDMTDGDEHPVEHKSTIGPYKDMYMAIKELSCLPFGNIFCHGKETLISDTQVNRR